MNAPMKPSEALRKARELISDPKRWTKGDYARTNTGLGVWHDSREARCWCAIGALRLVADEYECRSLALSYLKMGTGGVFIDIFNDAPERSHGEVLGAFNNAIALAEAAGQ